MHPISLLLLCLQTVRLSAFIADQQQRRPLQHAPAGITGSSHNPALRAKNGNKKAADDDREGGGYKFGDISRGLANRFTKRVEQVTGKEYEFGDLTRHLDKRAKGEVEKVTGKEYEFGDLSRWADARVKQRVTEITGKDDYQVGDLSKELLRRLLAGEVKWDEVLMLLKLLLSLGASFSPIGGMLPAKVLVDLLNYSIAAQVGEKVTGAISTELDRRMKEAVTGNPEYQLGDLTKAQMLKFIGKDEYAFGDLTKTVMQKLDAADKSEEKDRGDMLLFSDRKQRGDETTDKLELTNQQVLAELDSWDKAFKVDVD